MGFSLPTAIGAAAKGFARVAAITGDGSLQMNIQELQTLKHYRLPVKLFVWNNNGYLSIRTTQQKFFNSRLIGTDEKHGVPFPDLAKIADAYGLPFIRISDSSELTGKLELIMSDDSPVICEIMCNPAQEIIPSVASKRLADGRMKSMPLEDMYPFLDREEFRKNMLIEPLPEDF
jgi:acetolactate synthase-1/2/3 large subunit